MASHIIYLENDQFTKLAKLLGMDGVRTVHWATANIVFAKKTETLYELEMAYADGDQSLRVEQWPEGHVVWANGKIIFKSWET